MRVFTSFTRRTAWRRTVWRRTTARSALLLAALLATAGADWAHAPGGPGPQLFRIGTGGPGGTYYPLGSVLAAELTRQLGSGCTDGCLEPGLLAVAQSSNGSVSNVREITVGSLEAGLVQADIAHWAATASGVFAEAAPLTSLRAIGRLYPESLHVVASAAAGIRSFADLRGKRVALDEQGSGTLVTARLVLAAHGLSETDLEPLYIKAGLAAERMRAGKLDAFFAMAGPPVSSIAELAKTHDIVLLPIAPAMQRRISNQLPFLAGAELSGRHYRGTMRTPTLAVGALLVTRAEIDAETIHAVTRALWEEGTLSALARGHAAGRLIRRKRALDGLPVPLHPGAARYYREVGLLP